MNPGTSDTRAGRARTGHARRLFLLALLAAAALVSSASSASAVIVHLADGKTLSYQPVRGARPLSRSFDGFFSNLDYGGGPVMTSNTNYTLYWAPSGAAAYPAGYQEGVDRFFTDLEHDSGGNQNVDSVATQYNDAAGEFANYDSHFGRALIDTQPYPSNGCTQAVTCLTDAQIQHEIERYVKANGLPEGLTHEYFLLTPHGVENCFEAGAANACSAGTSVEERYCAYHGNIPVGETQIIYSNDAYVTGTLGCDEAGRHPNGKPSDGAIQGGLSHEHNESITDPEPNNAWTDWGGSGGENGDKCRNVSEAEEFGTPLGAAPNGSLYNQEINGDKYWYQQEWSNQGHKCLQRLAVEGERPRATFTASREGGAVHLDAGASTAPGGVSRYTWQFNEGPGGGPAESFETSSRALNHVFSTGPHLVALTVFNSTGMSAGTAKTIIAGTSAPTAAFSAAGAYAGTPVSFDGSASTSGSGSISSSEWQFGDGSGASGSTTTHTYAAAGSYAVQLSVTNSSGFTATVSHAVTLAAAPNPVVPVPVVPVPVPASVASVTTSLAPVQAVPLLVGAVPVHGSAQLVKVKTRRDGSADIFVKVSGAGLLSAVEMRPASAKSKPARARAASVRAHGAGVIKIHVGLASAGLRAITAKSHLTLGMSVCFATVAPALSPSPLRLTLHLSRRHRH